jgi:hypothetical protein
MFSSFGFKKPSPDQDLGLDPIKAGFTAALRQGEAKVLKFL